MEDFAMPMSNQEFGSLVSRQRAELGTFAEMVACAKFARAGYAVSRAINGTQRGYDIIVDDGSTLYRVQVKTISSSGQVNIGVRKRELEYATHQMRFVDVPKYKEGDFDVLAAVDRDTFDVYIVPVTEIDLKKASFGVRNKGYVTL